MDRNQEMSQEKVSGHPYRHIFMYISKVADTLPTQKVQPSVLHDLTK